MKKLTIKTNLNEQGFMESCLNMRHSGYDCTLPFLLYSLAKSWHIDKFTCYWNLLDMEKS